MAKLKRFKNERKQLWSRLTRLTTFFEQFRDIETPSTNQLSEIKLRLKSCDTLLNEFTTVQSEIELISNVDEEDEFSSFEGTYFSTIASMNDYIAKHSSAAISINPIPQPHAPVPLNETVKLPVIHLPTFSGSYEQWPEFHDTFKVLIHESEKLSEIQKFYYLRSCLKGDAAEVLRPLQVSASNYATAYQLLKDRFENKRLNTQSLLSSLFNLPVITKESKTGLRKLLDETSRITESLNNLLTKPEIIYDSIIIYLISAKFDPTTRRAWEKSNTKDKCPTFSDFTAFLKEHCHLLEAIEGNKPTGKFVDKNTGSKSLIATQLSCPVCKQDHQIYRCSKFLALSVNSRIQEVKRLHLCLNCLRKNHSVKDCTWQGCKQCNKQHNTLLHLQINKSANNVDADPAIVPGTSNNQIDSTVLSCMSKDKTGADHRNEAVLLSTAIIAISDKNGRNHMCRALLDPGSQSNFITQDLHKRLKLPQVQTSTRISGIGNVSSQVSFKTSAIIKSRTSAFKEKVDFIILPQITNQLPDAAFEITDFNIPNNISLADPHFNIPKQIDILLGAGIFWDLLSIGQIKLNYGPSLQKTKLGWVLGGSYCDVARPSSTIHSCLATVDGAINTQLKKFWEIEEINFPVDDDCHSICESHFMNTTTRDSSGRFTVNIPFKDNLDQLGESKAMAERRFLNLERKLDSNDCLKVQYCEFLKEYEDMGHMTKIDESSLSQNQYYLPHHGVIKESSTTTKLRVVFDGSAKSSTGVSLNDIQHVGPTVQNDLLSIIMRFRKHRYVLTADIAKMYRQILINPSQRDLQLILWRANKNEELATYRLNTVTYGTASAPFLATRCLIQLAKEFHSQFPTTCDIIKNDFYVDDLLTGSDSKEQLIQIHNQLNSILSTACFELRKWNSNSNSIASSINGVPTKETQHVIHNNEQKTLGIIWNPEFDQFSFKITIKPINQVTKRSILSQTAQIFDPLGLLGPIVITAKIILQQLWQLKLSWDESVPADLHYQWQLFYNSLHMLNSITIPRHIFGSEMELIEIHGFCDASERAYGACLYVRIQSSNNSSYKTNLLIAKSRVAPLKQLSIPRLELCGALLLAQLLEKATNSLQLNQIKSMHMWCDSTIVLCWLKSPASRWKTFVANRVGEIQRLTTNADWNHVSTLDNPADLLSRGVKPHDLKDSNIWWHGPSWLSDNSSAWPVQPTLNEDSDNEARTTTLLSITKYDLFTKFSSLGKLKRIIAYWLRFIKNSKVCKSNRTVGPLSVQELEQSFHRLIQIAQQECFSQEIHAIKNQKQLPRTSQLLTLSPFLDDNQVLRVGGRIAKSDFKYDKKHPIILPHNHRLTNLIIMSEHVRLFHAGATMTLYSLREVFWPIRGKQLTKQLIHNCVRCFKVKPSFSQPIMGSLPKERVTPSPPFYHTGVDYAGPFLIKSKKGRGAKLLKIYLCLFKCFATKAIHLELVSDLSTETFIAALRRFIARRGRPNTLYSDNATNFKGASSELRELETLFKNQINKQFIIDSMINEGVNFIFAPARSPHFNGLTEAGIKSAKYHMKRVIGNNNLTFEELYTFITQIEAILNSRPLTPMSSEPNNFLPLTPGHFIIGRPLTSLLEPDISHIKIGRLSRFQMIQQMMQHFWSRWSKEYISEMQSRTKWQKPSGPSINIGQLVLLKEDHLPPLNWTLGRISATHPGTDNVIRVVSVKLPNGHITKRAVTNVCALPIE